MQNYTKQIQPKPGDVVKLKVPVDQLQKLPEWGRLTSGWPSVPFPGEGTGEYILENRVQGFLGWVFLNVSGDVFAIDDLVLIRRARG